jgi:hypothetical protein
MLTLRQITPNLYAMKIAFLSLGFVLLFSSGATAAVQPPAEKPGLAALDLEVIEGVSAGIGKMLNQVMMQRLAASNRFSSLLGMGDVREMIDLDAQKQALGCDQESCLAEIGGALGVPLLMVPSLGRIGDVYLLTLKINDVENAKVSVRISRELHGEGELLGAMKSMVDEALMRHFEPQAFAVAQATKLKRKKGFGRKLGMGLIAAGVVSLAVADRGIYAPASSAFAKTRSAANHDNLESATQTANLVVMSGLGLALGGGISWWLLD